MNIFDLLKLIGGLSLFLFGMDIMGQALERRAGSRLRTLLGRFTTGKTAGLLTGIGVTSVIQSSSATTVMVVGFVNSGLMTLRQAINVIMGANIGTTITAWVLSLGGIQGSNIFLKLLKPTSFTPILALIGIVCIMFLKGDKKRDTGTILLGFAVLMFGMDTMSGAVSGLADVPEFQNLFIVFKNPLFGAIAGAVLTAIIQSSSASVGILQALSSTGRVSFGAAIPIIMGQNIGTCITAVLSSIGANKNAKRAAMVHLSFNIIGTAVWLAAFWIIKIVLSPAFLNLSATYVGIAVAHTVFNVLCTVLLLPMSGILERLVKKIVPDSKEKEKFTELDERLLLTPPIALERCRGYAAEMAGSAVLALKDGIKALFDYSPKLAQSIKENERKTDHYEDVIGSYLVKLSGHQISAADSNEAAKLLKIIGDFERISDYGTDLLRSAEEIKEKEIRLTKSALAELTVICGAVGEILDLSLKAFLENNTELAKNVEPLEQVIDSLKEQLRTRHIIRMQKGECTIETGFIWSDLLTALERTSDHCSNIAGCVIEMSDDKLNLHKMLREFRNDDPGYKAKYKEYLKKYSI